MTPPNRYRISNTPNWLFLPLLRRYICALQPQPEIDTKKKEPGFLLILLCLRYLSSRGTVAGIKKNLTTEVVRSVFALPIFPGSHPPSIVGVHELNFCVRDGNRWTLMTINTNYLVTHTGFEPMLTA